MQWPCWLGMGHARVLESGVGRACPARVCVNAMAVLAGHGSCEGARVRCWPSQGNLTEGQGCRRLRPRAGTKHAGAGGGPDELGARVCNLGLGPKHQSSLQAQGVATTGGRGCRLEQQWSGDSSGRGALWGHEWSAMLAGRARVVECCNASEEQWPREG